MGANEIIADKITTSDSLVDNGLSSANDFAEVAIDLITQTAPSVEFDPEDQGSISYETVPATLPSEIDATLPEDANNRIALVDDTLSDIDDARIELNSRLAAFTAELDTIAGRVADLADISNNIYIPIESDFIFSELPYSDDLDTALRAKLTAELAVNGDGLSTAADSALYRRNSERAELMRQKKIDAAFIKHCGRGFSMPQGFHVKDVDEINDAHKIERDGVATEIMQSQTKLALENKWAFLGAGVSYNQQMIDFCNKQAERGLSAAAEIYDFTIQAIRLRLGILEKEMAFAKDDALLLIKQKIVLLDQYKPELAATLQKISALIDKAKTYITTYRVNASVYLAEVMAESKASRLAQADNELALADQKEIVSIGATAAKANLKSFEASQKIKLSGYKSIGNMHAKNIASSIHSINAVVQLFEKGETTIAE